jgi:two-component system, LytTR family, response regulator
MKYTAVIVDDEPKLREVLAIKLNKYCPEIEIVAKAENAQEGYEAIMEFNPNLVFLDISMPGESGFEMLSRFEKIDFTFIFVTGFNEYGLEAIRLSAADYLLKPVKTEDLILAVNKSKEIIDTQIKVQKYENLIHNINNTGNKNSKIAIPGSISIDFIKISEIIRCEGWEKYTKIYTENKGTIISSYNLGNFKDMLGRYGFYECHKSHLINPDHIEKYLKEGTIIMSDKAEIPVSRRKKDEFINDFTKNQ